VNTLGHSYKDKNIGAIFRCETKFYANTYVLGRTEADTDSLATDQLPLAGPVSSHAVNCSTAPKTVTPN